MFMGDERDIKTGILKKLIDEVIDEALGAGVDTEMLFLKTMAVDVLIDSIDKVGLAEALLRAIQAHKEARPDESVDLEFIEFIEAVLNLYSLKEEIEQEIRNSKN